MNQKQIIIFTSVYQKENTLVRTIESVLNQDYQNFVYYLLDNASKDGSRDIIDAYSARDKRFFPLYNDVNRASLVSTLMDILDRYEDDGSLFTVLDADDEYKPGFFGRMLEFAEENSLDIAAGGSDFLVEKTGRLYSNRKLDQTLIISGQGFSAHFIEYHQFMRTVWGKVYRLGLLRTCEFQKKTPPGFYGGDTLFATEAFRRANRVGILAGTLHKYYISPESGSYKWNSSRVESDRLLDDVSRAFLMEKCGKIISQNEALLLAAYSNAVRDTVKLLLNCEMPFLERINIIKDIAQHKKTQALLPHFQSEKLDQKFRSSILSWLLEQSECRWPEGAGIAADILLALYRHLSPVTGRACLEQLFIKLPKAIGPLCAQKYADALAQLRTRYTRHDADNALFTALEIKLCRAAGKPDDEIFELLLHIRHTRPQSSMQLNTDAQIQDLFAQYPLLSYITAGLADAFSHSVRLIIKQDYQNALESFFDAAEDIEIPDGDSEAFLTLGQNLAAAAEDTGAFIYFKKVWISWLLDAGRDADAAGELAELEELLPNDGDLAAMRSRLRS